MTIRALLAAYAAGAVMITVALAIDPGRGPVGDAGLVVFPLAAAGHAWAAVRYSRTALIVAESVLVPLQFVLSIPSNAPLLGMLLSAAILAVLRPRFPQLRPRTRKLFLWLHVGFSVGWLGLSLAMLVLSLVGLRSGDRLLRHDAYVLMHLFDLVVVVPVVLLSILTGLVVSLGTRWGLVRNRWVLTKFLLSLLIPAVAGVQHQWIGALADRSGRAGALGVALSVCMAGYGVVLWTTTALSVWKPWGPTRWGVRAARERRRDPRPVRVH